jgi:hypothetical protein
MTGGVGVVVFAVAVAAAAVLYMAANAWAHHDPGTHRCMAPCVVVLPAGTQEDEFDFDYGWTAGGTPVVGVWKKGSK